MKNYVLKNSYVYENHLNIEIPENYIYNEQLGFWINIDTNEPLMLEDNMMKPQSKKCDVETGEDKKGE